MQRQINRNTKIVLEGVHDTNALTKPLFAINWFNTRSLWLYNIYNTLASRCLLRMAAVRDFSFALNQRSDGPDRLERRAQSFDPNRAWAVYLYSSDRDIGEDIQTLRAIADEETITLHFASWRAAIVRSENSGGIREPLNCVTDRVAILEAESQARLRAAVAGRFGEFACSVSNSYIGLLNRMM